jgi:hypothetical protein
MKITITEKHLDLALAVPWSTSTCLLAQAAGEVLGRTVYCGLGAISFTKGSHEDYLCHSATPLQKLFDSGHLSTADRPELINQLRNLLPVEIELKKV